RSYRQLDRRCLQRASCRYYSVSERRHQRQRRAADAGRMALEHDDLDRSSGGELARLGCRQLRGQDHGDPPRELRFRVESGERGKSNLSPFFTNRCQGSGIRNGRGIMSALIALKRRAQMFVAALAAVAILSSPAFAMRVSPMVVEMESRGSDAVARVEVQ